MSPLRYTPSLEGLLLPPLCPKHQQADPGQGSRSLPLLVVLGVLLGWYLSTRPKTYDDGGTATVTYTDADGSYQILLGWMGGLDTLTPEVWQDAEAGTSTASPPVFLSATPAVPPPPTPSCSGWSVSPFGLTSPGTRANISPTRTPRPTGSVRRRRQSVLSTFRSDENRSAAGTWTVTMKNGDVLTLRQTLNVEVIQTLNYYTGPWEPSRSSRPSSMRAERPQSPLTW